MKSPVFLKSNRYGITMYFDPDIPYDTLLRAVKEKFTASARFFDHADMVVQFAGRTFTKDEELQVVEIIEEAAGIHIPCVLEQDETTEKIYKRVLEDSKDTLHAKDGMFYKGTLRGRQVLESETSIVIIGDVEEGATVVSRGNVVVTGTIYGTVIAGVSENYEAIIAALHMRPVKLKIGDIQLKPVRGGSYSWARLL